MEARWDFFTNPTYSVKGAGARQRKPVERFQYTDTTTSSFEDTPDVDSGSKKTHLKRNAEAARPKKPATTASKKKAPAKRKASAQNPITNVLPVTKRSLSDQDETESGPARKLVKLTIQHAAVQESKASPTSSSSLSELGGLSDLEEELTDVLKDGNLTLAVGATRTPDRTSEGAGKDSHDDEHPTRADQFLLTPPESGGEQSRRPSKQAASLQPSDEQHSALAEDSGADELLADRPVVRPKSPSEAALERATAYSLKRTSGRPRKQRRVDPGFVSTDKVLQETLGVDVTDVATTERSGDVASDVEVQHRGQPPRKRQRLSKSSKGITPKSSKADKLRSTNANVELEAGDSPNVGQTLSRFLDTPDSVKSALKKATRKLNKKAPVPLPGIAAKPAESIANPGRAIPPTQIADEHDLLKDADPKLVTLSEKLMLRHPIASKPDPAGQPLVWADSRQAMTETLPYFPKLQGGSYTNNGHVYAFLFDGVGHCREYMDENVIISRAGGKMSGDESGKMVQSGDQSVDDTQVMSLQNDIEHCNPVIIIGGRKNETVPTKMPHSYCVWGWYKPIAIWSEKTLGAGGKLFNTVKYRFERLGADQAPWFGRVERPEVGDTSVAGEVQYRTCDECGVKHAQIYLLSWLCLNASCSKFWQLPDGTDAPYGTLRYHPAFLLNRTAWVDEMEPASVRPPIPDIGNALGDDITRKNTRGVVCPQCGRCNSRYRWEGWVCDADDCNWSYSPERRILKRANLHKAWNLIGAGPPLTRNIHRSDMGVTATMLERKGFKVILYELEGIEGRVLHAMPSAEVNALQGHADDMFENIQKNDLGLQRRRFNVTKGSSSGAIEGTSPAQKGKAKTGSTSGGEVSNMGEGQAEEPTEAPPVEKETGDFMSAFSINYGMPYKFIAKGGSQSFEAAPEAIRACRSMLNYHVNNLLGEDPTGSPQFNELLVFAYLESQKLEYHDDGESGLGPRIATMSLGGPAKMYIRMKLKYLAGCSKSGQFVDEKPLPRSCYKKGRKGESFYEQTYDARVAGYEELQALKTTDKKKYKERLKELPKEIGLASKANNPKADDILELELNHGDIVVMEGYALQKYFEHKVEPEDLLRFALTCRTILPHHLKEEELPPYEVRDDEYGYAGPKFGFEGSEEGGKEVTEQGGKEVTEKITKEVTEEVAEKVAGDVAGEGAQEGGKEGTEESAVEVTEAVTKGVTEEVAQEVAQEAAEEGGKETGEEGVAR